MDDLIFLQYANITTSIVALFPILMLIHMGILDVIYNKGQKRITAIVLLGVYLLSLFLAGFTFIYYATKLSNIELFGEHWMYASTRSLLANIILFALSGAFLLIKKGKI